MNRPKKGGTVVSIGTVPRRKDIIAINGGVGLKKDGTVVGIDVNWTDIRTQGRFIKITNS
jgi:hypothetical protein